MSAAAAAPAAEASPGNGPESLLRDPREIAQLLQRALDTRALLSLTQPRVLQPLTSLLLALEKEHNRLRLDAPLGGPVPLHGTAVRIAARLSGARFEFVTEACAGPDRGDGSWHVQLPGEALYLQRRSEFRLNLSRLPGLIGAHFFDQSKRFRGRLVDLSQRGMSTRLIGGADIPVGSTLECVIDLPGTHVSCAAEVRWRSARSDAVQIGIRFKELAPQQQQRLSAALAALQRQLLRRSS